MSGCRLGPQRLLQGRSEVTEAHPKGVVGREGAGLAGVSLPGLGGLPHPPLLPTGQPSPSEAGKASDADDIQVLEPEKAKPSALPQLAQRPGLPCFQGL